MQDINIFNNVLSEDFLDFLREEINNMSWYKQVSSHKNLHNSTAFFLSETSHLISHTYLFDFFCKKYSLHNKKIRSYVNCYPPHSFGNFHQDDGEFTFLFFPDLTEKNKGGTIFKDKTKIDYKSNRLIIFKADLPHKAEKNTSLEMRHSIAWKTVKA